MHLGFSVRCYKKPKRTFWPTRYFPEWFRSHWMRVLPQPLHTGLEGRNPEADARQAGVPQHTPTCRAAWQEPDLGHSQKFCGPAFSKLAVVVAYWNRATIRQFNLGSYEFQLVSLGWQVGKWMCQKDAKLPGGRNSTSRGTRKPGQSSGSTFLGRVTFPLYLCP